MKRPLIVAIALLLSLPLLAGMRFIEVKTVASYEKMLELARTTQKGIFVFVEDANCSDCQKLTKETFKDKTLNTYLADNYIALKVGAGSTLGGSLIDLYGIEKVPSLLFLNAYELIFGQHEGFIEAQTLLPLVQKANGLARQYASWSRAAAAGTLPKLEYIQFLLIELENNRITTDHRIIREVSSMLDSADFANPLVLQFVQELCLDIDGPVFQTLLVKPNWITDTLNFSWTNYQANVYNYNVGVAITKKDSVYLEEALLRIPQMPHFSPIFNFAFKGRQLYLAELNKWKAYDTLTFAYLEALPTDSADVYQREAMHLMEFYPQPQANRIALKFLRKGLERQETFNLYYTLSLWLFNDGDMPNAYKSAFTAERLAVTPEDKKLAKQLQRWIEQQYY